MQLDALDFVDNVILRFIYLIPLLLIESGIFVYTAARLLQWAISVPVHLHNLLVISGFDFVIGLTNLFFILIFVGIALAFILRTETFGMKKALPNLIIIALLINFSLVFVGMIVDIGDIFRNALLTSFGTDFVSLAIGPLESSGLNLLKWVIPILVGHLAAAIIPYISVASLVTIGGLFLSDLITGGILSKSFFLMILNFITGSIFFLYSGLFLVRIAIIWMLAIAAPLALFAYILPTTKKYFSQWLHYLLSWALMGIVAVFLIGMGLKLFAIVGDNALLPWGGDIDTGRGVLPGFIYNYLFLIIYLAVAFFACKKFAPMGADVIMNQGGAFVGKTWEALKRTRTMGKAAGEIAAGLASPREKMEELKKTGKTPPRSLRFRAWASRGPEKLFGPSLTEYAARMQRVSLPDSWKEMTVLEKERYITPKRKEERLILASKMKEEGAFQNTSEGFKKQIIADVKKLIEVVIKKAIDFRYKKEAGDILDALPDKITKEIKIEFELAGISPIEIDAASGRTKRFLKELELNNRIADIAKEYGIEEDEAAGVLHIQGLKPKDISEVSKGSLETNVFRLATRKMSSAHLQALQNNFDNKTVRAVLDEGRGLNMLTDQEIINMNTSAGNQKLFRWAYETPGGREMLNWSSKVPKPSPPPSP